MLHLSIPPFRSPGTAYVEGDASSASYFLAGAAVTGGTITVEGCGTTSLQVCIMIQNFNYSWLLYFCKCSSLEVEFFHALKSGSYSHVFFSILGAP